MSKVRVLLLTYGVPWPLNSGARIRDFNLIQALAGEVEITLCCFAKDEREIPDLSELRKICREVRVFRPPVRSMYGHAVAIGSAFRAGRPLATCSFFYPELAAELRLIAESQAVDIFQVEHSFLAAYVCAAANCRTVLSFHNVGYLQYARMARLDSGFRRRLGFRLKALLMRHWEASYAGRFHHSIAVSPTDAALLRTANPALQVSVVENGVDCRKFQPLPEAPRGNDLLFTGVLGYPPNTDAVRFFCARILPLVRRDVPDARVLIVGENAPPEISALASSEVAVISGGVDDLVPYYRQARVSVVPLRAGGGTRLKILESMALGRAVVSTSIGCEGLDVEHGRDLLIADAPDEFAASVVSLLRDGELRRALAARARRIVETKYDWPLLASKLLAVYRSLLNLDPR